MIGIIGGTGLEKSNFIKKTEILQINTEFGKPSSGIITGYIENKKIAIISRHGLEHTITPTHVNNRANISALKEIGCKYIIATTACGSLRENIKPGDFVIPNQFIDFTKHRINTFYDSFEPKKMQHCPMADPYSAVLRTKIKEAAKTVSIKIHTEGTILTIEGPRFSTRSESNMFRSWGADLINMSTAPETALANEAGIPYAIIAISTDYDCWKTDEEPVSLEIVLQNFAKSVSHLIELLNNTVKLI